MNYQLIKFLKIKLFSLLLISILLASFVSVNASDNIINSYRGEEPTIDGIVDINEELGTGKPAEITLPHSPWDPYGEPRKLNIKVGSSYTNDSYLYINTIVNFKNIITGNITYTFYLNITQSFFDMKRVSSITNSSIDGYRTNAFSSWTFFNDLKRGGTQDSEGRCVITSKAITFELGMPFNSGDSLGFDENLTIGDEVYFIIVLFITYKQTNDEIWYGDFFESDCLFKILNTTATVPLSILGTAIGLVLIIGITARRKRREKEYRKIIP